MKRNADNATQISRRGFLGAGASALAFTVVPHHVLGGPANAAPSEKLILAGVGIGGMGKNYIDSVNSENIAFLCDVNDIQAEHTYKAYPKAKIYRDFRKMLDEEKSIDGVVIGAPDHTHTVVAMKALGMGKHVYCAKPLTRTIHEARTLTEAAAKAGVATQMSVQSDASEDQRIVCEWIADGAIGSVREVHVWSDRPIWPQGLDRPKDTPPIPKGIDWDLWLGPAPHRPYHSAYVPFKWRGWCDFGTGALGDMGCHSLAHVFKALNLGPPECVYASSTRPYKETFPAASIVNYEFPARGEKPAVKLTWYDGGLKPPRPDELENNRNLSSSGLIFTGDKGSMLCGFAAGDPKLLPESKMRDYKIPPKTLPRSVGHYKEWVEACKGGKPAGCNFSFGGPLTEAVLLGNIALRTEGKLYWDAKSMLLTNSNEANRYTQEPYRPGWTL